MKKRVVLTAIVVALCGFIGGFVSLYFITERASAPESTQEATKTETEPQPVMVKLPGAEPVQAMLDDYNEPSSQWVVASKDHPLTDQQYRPDDLVVLTSVKTRQDKSADERSLRRIVIDDLNKLFQAGEVAGYDFMIGSGFRSYDLQAFYYNNYVATSGEAAANKFSAKPGQSEHQTGLAFDISLASQQCYLDTCFGDTAAGKWLAAHAPSYGFIIRYPVDKTEITKYQYEPWHLRYVGQPLASALKESGLTLDEAYPYLQTARDELIKTKRITVR